MVEFLKEGWYLGIEFDEGPLFFRVKKREIRYVPVTATTVSANSEATFEPKDSSGNRLLEPQREEYLEHTFIGIYPPEVELSMEFPPQTSREGMPGFVFSKKPYLTDGVRSPYTEPTFEVFTLKDLYPILKLRNPTDTDVTPKLNLAIAFYKYQVVTDEDLINRLIDGKVPCKMYAFLSPITAPNWLRMRYSGVMAIGKRYW